MKKLMLFFILAGFVYTANCQTETKQAEKLYFEGLDLHFQAEQKANIELDRRAEILFRKAIELDSAFAPALVQLGWIHLTREERNFWDENYLDSAFYFANRALHFNKESAAAYGLLGMLYQNKGMYDKALEACESALLYDTGESAIYRSLAGLYFNKGDYLKAVEYSFKQYDIEKNSGDNYWTLNGLFYLLCRTGYLKESNDFNERLLILTDDSAAYNNNLIFGHFISGNFDSVIELAKRGLKYDPNNQNCQYFLGWANLYKGNYTESYHWFNKITEESKASGQSVNPSVGCGFVCLQKGMEEEADFHFDGSVQNSIRVIEANYYSESILPYLTLACIYSAKGEKEKALEQLNNNKSTHLQVVTSIKFNPMFDNIRNEPEFQKILKEVETKYEDVHQRVGKFLEE